MYIRGTVRGRSGVKFNNIFVMAYMNDIQQFC